jgi:hypothetical protein
MDGLLSESVQGVWTVVAVVLEFEQKVQDR